MSNKQRQQQQMATAGERWARVAACWCVCPGLDMRQLMSSALQPAPLPAIVTEILLD